MEYSRYKKYYKTEKISEGADKKENPNKRADLLKPIPIKEKTLSESHQKLIKNALIIQQRQFNRISQSNPRTRNIIEKHNQIMKNKSLDKIMDIFKLIEFFE